MADDLDDIEDLLDAPYKNDNHHHNHAKSSPPSKKSLPLADSEDVAPSSLCNGNGHHHHNNESNSNNNENDGDQSMDTVDNQDAADEPVNGKQEKQDDEEAGGDETKPSDQQTAKEGSSSKSSSKKSKRDRSRSRSGHRHKKRSRSRSRSKKHKRSRSKDRERRKRSKSREHKRSRSRQRSRSKRRSRSRTRSGSRRRHGRSRHSRSRSPRRSRTPPRRARSPELTPEERDQRTVFCMQLSARIRQRDLQEFFSKVGKVRDVRLITDPRTKRSKGIAYIEFRDVATVPLALNLTGQRVLGVPILVKLTQAEKNRMPYPPPYHIPANIPPNGPMKLYVGSLHVDITEDMLRGIFEPFGNIDVISLAKDDFGRSKGFGYIQFSHAEDAKKAIEQLNNFVLANRPIKVAPFTEKTNHDVSAVSTLDNDDLDRTGVNLGPSGKLALMAKLAEGTGLKVPKYTLDALSVANAAPTGNGLNSPLATQCFLLSNMFDLEEEKVKPDWKEELSQDIIDECSKYGGIVHLSIDEVSPEGNIYVKCPTIAVAMSAMASLNGRYFAGKQISATFVPIATYHQKFPDAIACTKILTAD